MMTVCVRLGRGAVSIEIVLKSREKQNIQLEKYLEIISAPMDKATAKRSRSEERRQDVEDMRMNLRLLIDNGAPPDEIKAGRKAIMENMKAALAKPASSAEYSEQRNKDGQLSSLESDRASTRAADDQGTGSPGCALLSFDVRRPHEQGPPRFQTIAPIADGEEEYLEDHEDVLV